MEKANKIWKRIYILKNDELQKDKSGTNFKNSQIMH